MTGKEALDALAEIWRDHQIPMSDYNGRVFDAIEEALLRDEQNGTPILEDDGCVAVDWRTDDRDILSFSFWPDGGVSWAFNMPGGQHGSGVAKLSPEAFLILRKLVQEERE